MNLKIDNHFAAIKKINDDIEKLAEKRNAIIKKVQAENNWTYIDLNTYYTEWQKSYTSL